VVETPAARREVVETHVERAPERRGMSTGAVAALVIGAVALVTILFLFLMNKQQQEADNTNVRVTTMPTPVPQTTIIQQPAPVQQPPIIVQQPPATTTQPVVVTPPATTTTVTTGGTDATASGTDDATVQSNIDKKLSDDPKMASLGVIATVANGRVTLTGSVDTDAVKRSVERSVRSVKGVKGVDNQLIVSAGMGPSSSPE